MQQRHLKGHLSTEQDVKLVNLNIFPARNKVNVIISEMNNYFYSNQNVKVKLSIYSFTD